MIEDTLLGFQVPPFQTTQKRKAISRSKFFYFDLGVCNTLLRRPRIEVGSELFGRAFEHFIALELRAANKLLKRDEPITYWRTKSGFEVDFVIGDHTAIEVKATTQITDRHLKGLRALKEENKLKEFIVVSQDSAPRKTPDGIRILPWEVFLREWWRHDQTNRA